MPHQIWTTKGEYRRRNLQGRAAADLVRRGSDLSERSQKSARNLIPRRRRRGTSPSASPHAISLWYRPGRVSGALHGAAQHNAPRGEIRAEKGQICASEGGAARGAEYTGLQRGYCEAL